MQSSMEVSEMEVARLGSFPASVMKASISPTKVVHPGISPDGNSKQDSRFDYKEVSPELRDLGKNFCGSACKLY